MSIAANPTPDGLEAGHLDLGAGQRLRTAIGRGPREMTSRGTVILLQGRNEALEKYFETIADLNRMGFTVATFDWRGQGGSSRRTPMPNVGHVARFSTLTGDLTRFLHEVVLDRCPGPYAVLAHSLGGLVALSASSSLSPHVERMVLTAPLVALPAGAGMRALQRLVPSLLHWCGLGFVPVRRAARFTRRASVERSPLTSDPVRFARNRALQDAGPHLFVEGLSASWLRAVLKASRRLENSDRVAALDLPTLFLLAGDERVVSTPKAERLAWRMRSGHSIRVPGARHEILQEADIHREPALAAIEAFLNHALPRAALPPIDEASLERAVAAEAPADDAPAPSVSR